MNQKQEAVLKFNLYKIYYFQELWMDKLCQDEMDKNWNKMKEQWDKDEVIIRILYSLIIFYFRMPKLLY